MSETTQEIVSAIKNRKQEQNKKVNNLKSKFKPNVKVKIPNLGSNNQSNLTIDPNSSEPFNLEQGTVDNSHHSAMSLQQNKMLVIKSEEMKMSKKQISAAQA